MSIPCTQEESIGKIEKMVTKIHEALVGTADLNEGRSVGLIERVRKLEASHKAVKVTTGAVFAAAIGAFFMMVFKVL